MYTRLLGKSLQSSPKSILLLGPRQVGKSTLIKQLKPDMIINLASEKEYFDFQSHVGELENRLEGRTPKTVFIDEIQRIPRLLNTVQALLDEGREIKFFLTGSSARKLRKGRANLLPGRLFSYEMAPLCVEEMATDWNVNNALQFGSLPGVLNLKNSREKKKLLLSYANTYLKEEILAESLVRGIDGFVRFLREAAVMAGDFLDYSKLSRRAKVPRQSVVRHFEVLEDTLIVKAIENDPDLDSAENDLIKHPRYFLFDVGVCNALKGSFDISGDRIGSLWEHLVFNQLVNTGCAKDIPIRINNFRTRGGLEVDFIVQIDGVKFAIECKATQMVTEVDTKNLGKIKSYYRKIEKLLIYFGPHPKKINGVWALPLPKALKHLGL